MTRIKFILYFCELYFNNITEQKKVADFTPQSSRQFVSDVGAYLKGWYLVPLQVLTISAMSASTLLFFCVKLIIENYSTTTWILASPAVIVRAVIAVLPVNTCLPSVTSISYCFTQANHHWSTVKLYPIKLIVIKNVWIFVCLSHDYVLSNFSR